MVYIGRGNQIPHCSFERLMAHPMLHCANVEALAEHSSRVCGTKSLEIELRRVETRTLRNGFAAIEHVLLSISSG
jgi:hypothetical protein